MQSDLAAPAHRWPSDSRVGCASGRCSAARAAPVVAAPGQRLRGVVVPGCSTAPAVRDATEPAVRAAAVDAQPVVRELPGAVPIDDWPLVSIGARAHDLEPRLRIATSVQAFFFFYDAQSDT